MFHVCVYKQKHDAFDIGVMAPPIRHFAVKNYTQSADGSSQCQKTISRSFVFKSIARIVQNINNHFIICLVI